MPIKSEYRPYDPITTTATRGFFTSGGLLRMTKRRRQRFALARGRPLDSFDVPHNVASDSFKMAKVNR